MRHAKHIDWTNLEAVVKYALELGPNNVVIKRPHSPNYNITEMWRVEKLSQFEEVQIIVIT